MTPVEFLTRYLQAYEARDIDAIAPMLAEDVRLQDWNLSAEGKQAVLAETRRSFEDARQLRIEVRQLLAGEGCAAAQLRIVVNDHIELEAVDVLHFSADGRIASIRAYKG